MPKCNECGREEEFDGVECVYYCPNCDDGFMDVAPDLWDQKKIKKESITFGYQKIAKALTYRMIEFADQKKLELTLESELPAHGICPYCLHDMGEERCADAAGDMDTRYVCKNDKCPIT